MQINDHKVRRSHIHDDIIKHIDSIFSQYGLEINSIHSEQMFHLTEYVITCSYIAPIYFLIRYDAEKSAYLASIVCNRVDEDQRQLTFFPSLEQAFEDAVFWYKEEMGCHARLYNILSKND